MFSGFRKFILRGNVVDLAVGVVIGSAFGTIVSAFVADLITPIIGIIGKVHDFSSLAFTINGSTFMIGHFINALISFVIVAVVVYFFVVVPVNTLIDKFKNTSAPASPTTKKCRECLSEIPKDASRCAFCTSQVS